MGSMKKLKSKNYRYESSEWDENKSEKVVPERRVISGVSTSIRLPKEMVAKLKKIALRKVDIGYQTLLKIWIAERLEEELAAKKS